MKKSVQNYIFIALGFTVILLLVSFHLLDALHRLMYEYNWMVEITNNLCNTTYSKKEIYFFGTGFNSFNFLLDTIIAIMVVLVGFIVFLMIYWREKEE